MHFTCFSLWTHKRPGTSCHLPSGLTSVSHRKCTNVIDCHCHLSTFLNWTVSCLSFVWSTDQLNSLGTASLQRGTMSGDLKGMPSATSKPQLECSLFAFSSR
jgi:hypothetical protein